MLKFNKHKSGFTLIELMIVVIIIGLLAALAIPRFMRASKKSKIAEAQSILKQIYVASLAHYEEFGNPPPAIEDIFGDGSDEIPNGFIAKAPSGVPRFTYDLDGLGGAVAKPDLTVDASLTGVSNLVIDEEGNLSGGTF